MSFLRRLPSALRYPAILIVIVSVFGCATATVPRKSPNSVLYVVREDALASYGDVVEVLINDQPVTTLLRDEYKALHVIPGEYKIEFQVFDGGGTLKSTFDWTGEIPVNSEMLGAIAFNFGWKSFNKFFKKGAFIKGNLAGEVDLINRIAPL